MPSKTKIRASQVTENTIEDKDGDTKIQVEESNDEDIIRFDTAGSQRMLIDATGQVGIGASAPGTQVQIEGTAPYLTLKNSTAENTDGGAESKIIFEDHSDTALAQIQVSHDGTSDDTKGDLIFSTHDGSALNEAMRINSNGNITVEKGLISSPSVLVNATGSPIVGQNWIRIARQDTDFSSGQTSQGIFLVTFVGREGVDERGTKSTYIITVKFTATINSPYFLASGTHITADAIDSGDLDSFDPANDLLITHEQDSTPAFEVWIRSRETHKHCYCTYLGGTNNINNSAYSNLAPIIQVNQTSASSITSLGNEIYGTWVDKTFNSVSIGTGTTSSTSPLHVQGNLDGSYVATIDNDQNTNGHVLKLLTDGNGTGSRLLEMEDGDGDIIFRARADGRFGFGPDGVSSMGAGTFVVGIDNSSHTSDIAISQRLQHLGDSDTYMDFPSNDNIAFSAGGVTQLQIDDDAIHVAQYIRHIGDTNTHINFTDDKIILKAGNLSMITMEEKDSAPHEVRVNNGGNNIDFVVEDNSGNAYFTADASTSRVGIGTTSPSSILTLNGTQPALTFRESDADRAEILINDSDNLVITNQSSNKYIVFKTNDAGTIREGLRIGGVTPEVVVNEGSDSLVDFRVESNSNTHMLFVDGGNEKVGIGTSSPTELLDIDGDSIRLRQSKTPSSSSATGTAGQIAWDANYLYVCVATDTWKRVAIGTW